MKNINFFAHLIKFRDNSSQVPLPDHLNMSKDQKFMEYVGTIEQTKKRKRRRDKGGTVKTRGKRANGNNQADRFYDEKKGIDGGSLMKPDNKSNESIEALPKDVKDQESEEDMEFDDDMAVGFDKEAFKFSEEKIEGIDYVRRDDQSSDSSDSDDNKKKKAGKKKRGHIPGKTLTDKIQNIKPKRQRELEEKAKNEPKRKTRKEKRLEQQVTNTDEMTKDATEDLGIDDQNLF